MSEQEHLEALIRDLADFRTRSGAMRELLTAGDAAVESLILALGHRVGPAVWSAAQVLGRLGDERAVGPLVEALERGVAEGAVVEALESITGRHFGDDLSRWKRLAAGQAVVEEREAPAKEVDPLDLVNAAIEGSDIKRARLNDLDFELTVSLPTGRTQRVRVLFNAKDVDGEPVIAIYSECGPARERTYEWALRRNLTTPYGAFAIREIQGSPHFVMVNTLLRRHADPRELRKSIDVIASRSDALERALTQADER